MNRPAKGLGVHELSYEERKWLYVAIWKLIVVDGRVTSEEFEDLRQAMSFVRKDEMEALEAQAEKDLKPFNPGNLEGLSFERALVMMLEMLRVASIDGELALEEQAYIEGFAHLLGFASDQAKQTFLDLGQEMTLIEQRKIALRRDLRPQFEPTLKRRATDS